MGSGNILWCWLMIVVNRKTNIPNTSDIFIKIACSCNSGRPKLNSFVRSCSCNWSKMNISYKLSDIFATLYHLHKAYQHPHCLVKDWWDCKGDQFFHHNPSRSVTLTSSYSGQFTYMVYCYSIREYTSNNVLRMELLDQDATDRAFTEQFWGTWHDWWLEMICF